MKTRIGHLLTQANLVTESQLARALEVQSFAGGRIGTLLLERGILGEDDLGRTLALQHGCGYISWTVLSDLPPETLSILPARFALKHFAIPYERGEGFVKMALRDPGDLRILDELLFVTGRKVFVAVTPEVRIYQALEKHYGKLRAPRFALIAEKLSRVQRTPSARPSGPPVPPDFFAEIRAAEQAEAAARALTLAPEVEPALSPDASPFLPPEPDDDTPAAAAASPPRPSPFGWVPSPSTGNAAAGEADELPEAISWEDSTGGHARERAPDPEENRPPAPFEEMLPFDVAETEEPAPFEEFAGEGFPAVAGATDRDAIADAILEALRRRFESAAIFSSRSDGVAGWAAAGDRVDPSGVRSFSASWTEPSVFMNARLSRTFYLGPLPALPRHDRLAAALGGWPGECVVQPIYIGERPVAFLLVTAVRPGAVTAEDLGYLRDLSEAASTGFKNAIRLKKKEI